MKYLFFMTMVAGVTNAAFAGNMGTTPPSLQANVLFERVSKISNNEDVKRICRDFSNAEAACKNQFGGPMLMILCNKTNLFHNSKCWNLAKEKNVKLSIQQQEAPFLQAYLDSKENELPKNETFRAIRNLKRYYGMVNDGSTNPSDKTLGQTIINKIQSSRTAKDTQRKICSNGTWPRSTLRSRNCRLFKYGLYRAVAVLLCANYADFYKSICKPSLGAGFPEAIKYLEVYKNDLYKHVMTFSDRQY